MGQDAIAENKAPVSCHLVAFEQAVIRTREIGGPLLVVSGTAPHTNMEVFLSHRIYDEGKKPEWWGIEVVGALPGGVCLDETKRFETAMPVSRVSGLRGIEVIGADHTLRLTVEPDANDI